jgi:hypothetical protein
MIQSPKSGDRVTLSTSPGEYQIVACFGQRCGLLFSDWPRGASKDIELHEIATVNDLPVAFAPPSEPQKKRRRKAA